MNIYVGNIARVTTEEKLRTTFEQFGAVQSVKIIKDRFTGEARGFAFVEMADKGEAEAAIAALNGSELDGRTLRVNESRPREAGSNGGGGFRREGGYRGGNSGGGHTGGGYNSRRY